MAHSELSAVEQELEIPRRRTLLLDSAVAVACIVGELLGSNR